MLTLAYCRTTLLFIRPARCLSQLEYPPPLRSIHIALEHHPWRALSTDALHHKSFYSVALIFTLLPSLSWPQAAPCPPTKPGVHLHRRHQLQQAQNRKSLGIFGTGLEHLVSENRGISFAACCFLSPSPALQRRRIAVAQCRQHCPSLSSNQHVRTLNS